MRRVIASLLLFLSLLGLSAPAALAFSAPAQTCCKNQCCRRKAAHVHPSSDPTIQNKSCCRQDCGCSLTVSQNADVASRAASIVGERTSYLSGEKSTLSAAK